MINLPLMMDGVCVNVNVRFKDMSIIRNQLVSGIKGTGTSDIIVGKTVIKLSPDSISNPKIITDMIRKSVNYSQDDIKTIQINTKKYQDSDFYDSYTVQVPDFKPNNINDYIYGMLINSIRLNTPQNNKKEKVSLTTLGFDKLFDNEFLNKITVLYDKGYNSLYVRNKLLEMGYHNQLEVLDFFNSLDYTIDDNAVILTDDIDNVLSFFKDTKKESRVLTNYKEIALSNYENYIALAAFNTLVNGRTLNWPSLSMEQQKTLQKRLSYKMKVA